MSFLRGLCCLVELLTPHRTEHRSKLLLDHRVTTFDFDRCSQHRSEPTAEAALLQSTFNAPESPLANVILMKSATRHWQRRDAAAMRCNGDAMQQRCDCDATAQMAMRRNRRESGAETGANPAQKPAQYVKVFPPKIQKDSDTYKIPAHSGT